MAILFYLNGDNSQSRRLKRKQEKIDSGGPKLLSLNLTRQSQQCSVEGHDAQH